MADWIDQNFEAKRLTTEEAEKRERLVAELWKNVRSEVFRCVTKFNERSLSDGAAQGLRMPPVEFLNTVGGKRVHIHLTRERQPDETISFHSRFIEVIPRANLRFNIEIDSAGNPSLRLGHDELSIEKAVERMLVPVLLQR